MTYLEEHPPARSQYRRPRRATPSGAIVIHTAENTPDLDGLDGGAEGVAAFIARRPDPGSYHTVVDADSIVRLVPYDAEAYGEGTGGNAYALHLSFACRTTTWDAIDPDRCTAMLRNGAKAAADMARWLDKNHPGHATPSVRIGADAYRRQRAGFISHAELDPGRRSDPGAAFPWGAFLDLYAQEMNMPTTPTPPSATERDLIEQWQQMLLDNGAPIGNKDGRFGRLTLEHSRKILDHYNQLLAQVEGLSAQVDGLKLGVSHAAEAVAEAEAEQGRLGHQLQEAHTEIARLQALSDVATKAPALLAIVQGLRAQLNEAEAKLEGLA